MIRINNDIREQKYEAAATQIDAMIADTTINQQELIGRLKFIARLGYKAEELPEFWFNKCVAICNTLLITKQTEMMLSSSGICSRLGNGAS